MHNDFSGTGIEKSFCHVCSWRQSPVLRMILNPRPRKIIPRGAWLTRDDGVLFILLQQIGRRAIGLAAAEDLAAMQTMLQVTFGLFLVNLGLAYRRVLNQ